jgi:hypothetical protein
LSPTAVRLTSRQRRSGVSQTIDEPADMYDLLNSGVDGIMTDHVDMLRDVASRGPWPP